MSYLDGGSKAQNVGVLGSSVQELQVCGSLGGFLLKSVQQQVA